MKAKDETTQKAVSLMRKYKRVAEKAAALSRVAENEQVRNYIKVYRLILLNRFLSISKHRSNSLTVIEQTGLCVYMFVSSVCVHDFAVMFVLFV